MVMVGLAVISDQFVCCCFLRGGGKALYLQLLPKVFKNFCLLFYVTVNIIWSEFIFFGIAA